MKLIQLSRYVITAVKDVGDPVLISAVRKVKAAAAGAPEQTVGAVMIIITCVPADLAAWRVNCGIITSCL